MSSRFGQLDRWILVFAIIVLIGLIYLYYRMHIEESYEGVLVGSVNSQKTIQQRHSRHPNWRKIRHKNNLFQRDYIYTPKNRMAEIELGHNRKLMISPETLIQIVSFETGELNLKLYRGKVIGKNLKINTEIVNQEEFKKLIWPKRWKQDLLAGLLNGFEGELEKHHKELERLQKKFKTLEKTTKEFSIKSLNNSLLSTRMIEDLKKFQNQRGEINPDDFKVVLWEPSQRVFYNHHKHGWVRVVYSQVPNPETRYYVEFSLFPDFKDSSHYPLSTYHAFVNFEEPGNYFVRIKSVKDQQIMYSNTKRLEVRKAL